MGKVQVIRNAKNEPAFAVVPHLLDTDPEDLALLAAVGDARKDDRFPAEVTKRLVRGENVLKVLREWRGMAQRRARGGCRARQAVHLADRDRTAEYWNKNGSQRSRGCWMSGQSLCWISEGARPQRRIRSLRSVT